MKLISDVINKFKINSKRNMVTSIDSLVKYETAILVSSAFVSKKATGGKKG